MEYNKPIISLDWDKLLPKAKHDEPPPEILFAGKSDKWLIDKNKWYLQNIHRIKLIEDELEYRKVHPKVEDESDDEIPNSSSCGDDTPNDVGGIEQNIHSTFKPYPESKRRKTRITDVLKKEFVSIRGGLDKLIINLGQGNFKDYDDYHVLYDEIEKIDGMREIVVMKVYQVLSANAGLARAFLSCPETKRKLWLLVRFGRYFMQNENVDEAFYVGKYKSSN